MNNVFSKNLDSSADKCFKEKRHIYIHSKSPFCKKGISLQWC